MLSCRSPVAAECRRCLGGCLGTQAAAAPSSLTCSAPPVQLMENEAAAAAFPPDVLARAREYLAHIPGGVGAYSDSKGALFLRQQVAQGVERRDGFPCDPQVRGGGSGGEAVGRGKGVLWASYLST